MSTIHLADDLEISRIVHGQWRLTDWELSDQELLAFIEQSIEMGVTTFDHADIYGDYRCEELFGQALALKPSLREKLEIVTKCGIKLVSDQRPSHGIKHYDYSYDHIVESVEKSLTNLGTDYIELLLLHRPAPFFDEEEAARAFADLKDQGKVQHFGVSNFSPRQFELLNAATDQPLITNQLEISPYCLDYFQNGTMEQLQKDGIAPMAWSPLAGGKIFSPESPKGQRIAQAFKKIANELEIETIDRLIYTWLLNHPSNIVPIAGTGKIERLRKAVEALDINMSLEQWYVIYTASTGQRVP